MEIRKQLRKICSIALAVSIVACMAPSVDAAVGTRKSNEQALKGLCAHHRQHTQECGYDGGGGEKPCQHNKHDKECYTQIKKCVHKHGKECYVTDGAANEEDESAVLDEKLSGRLECAHICDEENGCIKNVLDCPHDRGDHDEECGYEEAKEGQECGYFCELCEKDNASENDGVIDGNEAEDTSKDNASDENKAEDNTENNIVLDKCNCTSLCAEGAVNEECPVCSKDETGALCKAEDVVEDGASDENKVEDNIEDNTGQDKCNCTSLCAEGAVNEECPVCSKDETGESCEAKEVEAEIDTCSCTVLCTDEAVNEACPVCSLNGADLSSCEGEEAVTMPRESLYKILEFEELPQEVMEQPVPAQTALDKLNLPKTLEATGYEVTATDSDASVRASLTIEKVTWELTKEFNESVTKYDEKAETGGYIFTPVLPKGYTVDKDVALPQIMVKVGAVETQEAPLGLEVGATYYFNLSSTTAGLRDRTIPGTKNPSLPVSDLQFVPFTYVGTINAYAYKNLMESSTAERNLFISDYVLTTDVSWNTLEGPGWIFNGLYAPNGLTNSKLRAPSVGDAVSSGAVSPANNEWDVIQKKGSDLGLELIKNQDLSTIGQDKDATYANRGYRENDELKFIPIRENRSSVGYRPVLELGSGISNLKVLNIDLNGATFGGEEVIHMVCDGAASSWLAPYGESLPIEGKTFIKWNTARDGSGSNITKDDNTVGGTDTIYAQWQYEGEPPADYELFFTGSTLRKNSDSGEIYTGNDGRWSIDGGVLTLGGENGPFEFSTSAKNGLNITGGATTINLFDGCANKIESATSGVNVGSGSVTGVNASEGLTIQGTGSLEVIAGKNTASTGGNSRGIMALGDITIDSATVVASTKGAANGDGIFAMSNAGANLILKNEANVTADSGATSTKGSGIALGGPNLGQIKLTGANNKLVAKGTQRAVYVSKAISKYSYESNGGMKADSRYSGDLPSTGFDFNKTDNTYRVSGDAARYIEVTSIEGLPEDYSGGVGKEDEPYIIANNGDLEKLAKRVNEEGKDYEGFFFVIDDKAGSLKATTAIGGALHHFNGTFDGKGKTIQLDINKSANYQGLFGHIGEKGTVKNLGVTGSVTGGMYTGGVAGFNSGKVEKCYNTAAVTGSDYVGGVVGINSGGGSVTVQNCYNTGAVTGQSQVGGVAGCVENGSARFCYNTGYVKGTNAVGGIAGKVENSTLMNCVSLGMKVTGTGTVGRVAGGATGASLQYNSARSDMKIGPSGSEATTTGGGTDSNGEDAALGEDLASIFDSSWDSGTWSLPSGGKLEVDKELPALIFSDEAKSPAPTLPGFSIKLEAEPGDKAVTYGEIKETDTLKVTASVNNSPSATVTYQWYSAKGADGADPETVDGAVGAEFPIPTTLDAGEYYYFCRLSADGCQDKDSRVVKVEVKKGVYKGKVEKTILFKKADLKDGPKTGSITLADLFPDGVPAEAKIFPVIDAGGNYALHTVKVLNNQIEYTSASGDVNVGTGTSDIKITSKNYTEITGKLIVKIVDKTPVTVDGIIVTGAGKEYDGNAAAYTGGQVKVTDGGQDVTGTVSLVYKWQKKKLDGSYEDLPGAPKDAGSYRLAVSADPDSDYMGGLDIDFEIKKKKLTVSPQDVTITVGDAVPTAFKLKYDGLVAGDTLSPSEQPAFTCEAADTNTVSSYAITWTNMDATTFGGAAADNYEIIKDDEGTLTVDKKKDPTPGGNSGGGNGGGGNSGGGNSGGGSDSSSNTTTSGSGPSQSMTGSVDSNITVDEDGNANVTVTNQTVNAAVAAAEAEAQRRGVTVKDVSVVIQVTADKEAKQLNATLPKAVQENLLSQRIDSVEIRSSEISMRFTREALQQINQQAKSDVMITAEKVDNNSLAPQARAMIASRPAYKFTASYGDGGRITEFGTNSVFLEIPYTLAQGEKAQRVQLYYIDGGGALHEQFSSYNTERQTVTAVTSHYSIYAVGYRAGAPAYADAKGHWANEDIEFVAGRGLVAGAGAFAPEAPMTRGRFAEALGRLAGVNPNEYRMSSFNDVAAGADYAPYVEWAAKKGIITGKGDGQFGPDQEFTREQMAVSLAKFAGEMEYSIPELYQQVSFVDSASINTGALKDTAVMQRAGILPGKDGNRFDPQGIVTRGEAAAVLHRFAQRVSGPTAAPHWIRNDSGSYMYYEDGKAASGWKQLDGKWYYFNADKTLATDTEIDGYRIGTDGVRIEH